MNASELRIGNYVYCLNNILTISKLEVDRITIYDGILSITSFKGFENGIKPIPLTDEWLVKFGFEEEYNYRNRLIVSQGIYYDTIRKKNGYSIYKNKFRLCVIRYVHQLQNLYFALTGNELTIK